jgi:branched-subunit amino acid aminotransferase/4-amino-4-deoxychorismate lyase
VPTLWNGAPATQDQLAFLGSHNYGSFTVFQVRQRTVRGLALHVQRLRDNARELFGAAPTEDRLRTLVGQAVTEQDCSIRVTMVSRDVEALLAGEVVEPDVVITAGDPRPAGTVPIAVRTVAYQRETPWVKHRATHGLVREIRAARQAGFDDALFVDPQGRISEGTTWNLCLRTADCWVWPDAEVLQGITQQLLQAAMDSAGIANVRRVVPVTDLVHHQAAFALNATSPAKPIARVDAHSFSGGGAAAVQLEEIWHGIAGEHV